MKKPITAAPAPPPDPQDLRQVSRRVFHPVDPHKPETFEIIAGSLQRIAAAQERLATAAEKQLATTERIAVQIGRTLQGQDTINNRVTSVKGMITRLRKEVFGKDATDETTKPTEPQPRP